MTEKLKKNCLQVSSENVILTKNISVVHLINKMQHYTYKLFKGNKQKNYFNALNS